MADSRLPDDILIEIFLRLPTKSVGKCRCLSKTWCFRLSTSNFVNLHLTRKTHQKNILLVASSHSLHTISPPIKDDVVSRKLELPNTWKEAAGCCNGLVLLLNAETEMFLVNPITLQYIKIPDLTLHSKKVTTFRCGFGYDSFSDDYKIVILSYCDNMNGPLLNTVHDVYSVKLGFWRSVDSSPDHAINGGYNGTFINGAIHWFSNGGRSGNPSKIVAFDLGREAFREISCPPNVRAGKFAFHRLCVLEERLCMVDGENLDIWMMKEYGLASSWTKFSVVDNSNGLWDICAPLCLIAETELALVTFTETVLLYNLKERTTKVMVVDGVPATSFLDGVAFVDSLVSPNQLTLF